MSTQANETITTDKPLWRFKHITHNTILLSLLCALWIPVHTQAQLIQPTVRSEAAPTAEQLTVLRNHYTLAKKYLAKSDYPNFKKHQNHVKDYVLAPYLQYSYLKTKLKTLPTKEVKAFLATYNDSYLSSQLRHQWLFTLIKQKKWQEFLTFYPKYTRDKALQCNYLYAKYKSGDTAILNEAKKLWVSANSLPKLCNPLFSAWKKAGGITDEIAWQRYILAREQKKLGLARYITSLMSKPYKEYAALFHKVYGYPSTIRSKTLYSKQSAPMRDIISYGIKRYARHNATDAAKQWLRYEANQLFDTQTVIETKAAIIKQLIRKNNLKTAEKWIASSEELRSIKVMEPLIHHALQKENWKKVNEYIGLLDKQEQNNKRWLYWKARALIELDKNNHDVAMDIYNELAKTRSFYGFLSADILGIPYNLQHKTPTFNMLTQSNITNRPSIKRAKELWFTNRKQEAQAEWQFTMQRLSDEEVLQAGDIARSWGQHNQAIRTMIYAKQWDILDIRFPLAYQDEVNAVSTSTRIPTTLIYAVARQESAFLSNAKSRAGARGLMQLMPATAKQTASRGGIKHTTQDLYDPAHNILLGSRYLKGLLKKYDYNTVFATAAYNAGPHRVDGWLKKRPSTLPTDIWVETIPFRETRGYVKNVLAYTVIYAYRLGEKELKLNTHTALEDVL